MYQRSVNERHIDEDYEAWIEGLICLICHKPHPDPHHVNPKGQGGVATKTSDRRMIPLCNKHHREYHQIGRDSFAEKYAMDYEEIIQRLNRIYDEWKET